jgi:hypothetical protein
MNDDRFHYNIACLKNEETRQLTTFDPGRKSKTIPIPRGHRVTIGNVRGQGYIAQLWLTVPGWFWQYWDSNAPVSQTILKTLILRIYWDDEDIPAVQAPVGDFFGNGLCEISNFTSRYFGMSSGGFYCKFPMPFSKCFRVELENLDEFIDTEVFANILYQLTEVPLSNNGYFHANFHTAANKGSEPIHILEAEGRGHFVGCTLSAQGEEKHYLSFLEAPEYVYLDEDWESPRIVGTGLEDYFLGGWYFREGVFTGELHGVPSKDPLNSSITMYRIHENDVIRFNRRIRFQFVNPWDPDRLKPFVYSAVAFYYSDAPQGTSAVIPERNDLLCWYRIKNTDHISIP